MKKKYILIIVVVIILLLIPIPSDIYKDGGSREYSALTYKIVDWNAMYTVEDDKGEEQLKIFDETKLYLFPNNFRDINHLWDKEERKLQLSNKKENNSQNGGEGMKSEKPDENDISYEVQYIRTNGYVEDADYTKEYIICNREELESYYEKNRGIYDLERHEKVYADTTIGFLDACDKYTDEFFLEKYLVLVVLEEGSGSIRHETKKVRLSEYDGSKMMGIFMERIIPEACTDDMAEWHIIFEIDKANQVKSAEDVLVYLDEDVVIKDKHTHEPVDVPQIVSDPISGYCGNTVTSLYVGDEKYSFWGDKSVCLTNIVVNLDYRRDKLCRCVAEYKVDTEFGDGYEINLREGFVRYKQRQAELTQEQMDDMWAVIKAVLKEKPKEGECILLD